MSDMIFMLAFIPFNSLFLSQWENDLDSMRKYLFFMKNVKGTLNSCNGTTDNP